MFSMITLSIDDNEIKAKKKLMPNNTNIKTRINKNIKKFLSSKIPTFLVYLKIFLSNKIASRDK